MGSVTNLSELAHGWLDWILRKAAKNRYAQRNAGHILSAGEIFGY
jgi:hypothetical protein